MTTGRKVGSGGQRKRGLAGRGPTPKAEDRVYHKAYKTKQGAGQGGTKSGGRSPRPAETSRHNGRKRYPARSSCCRSGPAPTSS